MIRRATKICLTTKARLSCHRHQHHRYQHRRYRRRLHKKIKALIMMTLKISIIGTLLQIYICREKFQIGYNLWKQSTEC